MVSVANSARLTFRLMGQEDAQALWQLDQDPEVMRFINGGKPNSIETINEVFLPRMQVRPMDFFTDKPNFMDVELGWRFFKKAWGKGYATEAAIAIKDAVTAQTDIDHVSALALADNIDSIAVMTKMGMKFIREYTHKDPTGDFIAVHYQMSVK